MTHRVGHGVGGLLNPEKQLFAYHTSACASVKKTELKAVMNTFVCVHH